MPHRRIPKSLRTISKWEIARNLPIYSTDELQNLPTHLSEELIDLYNEEFLQNEYEDKMDYDLRFKYRNNLIKPNMKKLNLLFPRKCNEKFFHETLIMVLETCKNLTHFNCDLIQQPHFYLHLLVISLPNIIELKLDFDYREKDKSLEYIDDYILEAIGNTCFQLEILHLTHSRLTDDGVQRFCRSNSGGAKIKDLNLDDSRVTFNGCLDALRNLKQLRIISCQQDNHLNQVPMAFTKMFDDSQESSIPTFQLCEFQDNLYTDHIPTGFLSFVTKCCPNVRDFYVIAETNFDRHIKDMKCCSENVCLHLFIENVDNIMGNLVYIGCRVTELSLINCDVHLPTIGFSCPNLIDLTLWRVNFMPFHYVARNNSVVAYSKLLKLKLNSHDSLPISIEQLQFLLENCLELETLKIEYNDEFTDDLMFRILHAVNPLRCLTRFKLVCCNAVSVAPIFELLEMENDLKALVIDKCQNITRVACWLIDSFIIENNICLTLDEIYDETEGEPGDEPDDEEDDEPDDN